MNHTDVLIVGAGPTGLTAATILARYGVDVRIIDTKAGPVKESRALGVQARTLELWDKLGLAAQAVRDGQQVNAVNLLTKRTLKHTNAQPFLMLDRGGSNVTPYPFMLVYEQNKTERMLLNDLHAHGTTVMWNTELVSLVQRTDSVDVTLRTADGQEETVRACYVIGADGAHSFVRRTLDVGFDGATYAESLFIADVDMHWSLPRDTFYLQMPRHGLLAFFPMRGEGYGHDQYRIIGRVPREWANKEHITHTDLQQLLNRYGVVRASVTNVGWTSIYRVHKRMAEHFRIHRVFLVGDAAHIHSPAGGQGMNTGIQDAWILAWKVALVVRGEAQTTLLNSYEPERMPVARTLLNGTDRGFSVQASSNYVVHLFRSVVLPLVARLGSRDRLGARVFKLVSQTWINYRTSPAVAGDRSTTTAQPGDRAPYARFDAGPRAGESIFALLRGVDHHLLLFVGAAGQDETERWRVQAESLLAAYQVTTHTHTIDGAQQTLHAAYGAQSPTAVLVRPDGHIAWRGLVTKMDALAAYMDRLYLHRRPAARPAAVPLATPPHERNEVWTHINARAISHDQRAALTQEGMR